MSMGPTAVSRPVITSFVKIQRLRRLPEQRRAEVVHRAAEVGMVEDVEELGPGLQPEALAEGESPLHDEVRLEGVEAAQAIAR